MEQYTMFEDSESQYHGHFSQNWSVDSMQFYLKIPEGIFVETDKLSLKIKWKFNWPRIAKIILIKNKDGSLIKLQELLQIYSNKSSMIWTWR